MAVILHAVQRGYLRAWAAYGASRRPSSTQVIRPTDYKAFPLRSPPMGIPQLSACLWTGFLLTSQSPHRFRRLAQRRCGRARVACGTSRQNSLVSAGIMRSKALRSRFLATGIPPLSADLLIITARGCVGVHTSERSVDPARA